jgi:hypothetical protein
MYPPDHAIRQVLRVLSPSHLSHASSDASFSEGSFTELSSTDATSQVQTSAGSLHIREIDVDVLSSLHEDILTPKFGAAGAFVFPITLVNAVCK